MKDENDNYLCTVYPKLFENRSNKDEPMYYGFSCGDGWFNILNLLCRNIQSYLDWHKECPQVEVLQVKEKFGGLRFYYTGGDDYVAGLVSMAEAITEVTCEQCGEPGEIRHGGWIKVLCDKHNLERKKKVND